MHDLKTNEKLTTPGIFYFPYTASTYSKLSQTLFFTPYSRYNKIHKHLNVLLLLIYTKYVALNLLCIQGHSGTALHAHLFVFPLGGNRIDHSGICALGWVCSLLKIHQETALHPKPLIHSTYSIPPCKLGLFQYPY